MRYLLAIWDGGGATPPNLGIARMLVERGHDVVAYGDPTLAEAIEAAGALHRTWPTAPQRTSTALTDDVLKDWECRTPIGAVLRLRDRLIAGPSEQFAGDVDGALRAERFDAVLADGILLGALIGAEANRVPAAALVGSVYLAPSRVRPPAGRIPPARGALGRARDRIGFAAVNLLWDGGLSAVNKARAAHGLDAAPHLWSQWERAHRVLMLTGSAFDDPPPDAPNVRYVGPVLEDTPADGTLELPAGTEPLVVVGLSSSYMEQSDLLRRISEALASLPVRGVITTGPAVDPAEIPGAPNVVIVQAAQHSELFRGAAAVVTHAGHGTLIKAIAASVPSVCIPLGRDQPDNAARAARHGVGIALSPHSNPATIADAIHRLLSEPSFQTAVATLGERVREEIASGALIRELEQLPEADSAKRP
jgi:MGT family glycosyltransferase